MKAAVFEQCGSPADVLAIRDVPRPSPGRGEVLVRMIASPINPSDLMYIRGAYGLKPKLPATPGFEGVGIVEASGGGLLGRLRVGKRVAVINDRQGNWSEFTVTKARQVVPVPDDIPDEQAASFFVNPATAVAMTHHVFKLKQGDWLLQTAAASALGRMIIRLGQAQGFHTINVVRRSEQVGELRDLGADHVLVENDGPLSEQVRRIRPEGLRYVIDAVGGATGTQATATLAPGGRMLVYGALSDAPIEVEPRFLITTGARIEGFWLANWSRGQSIPTMLGLFRQVRRLIRDGVATTATARVYSLDQIREAVSHAAQPNRGGKILLKITG